MEKDNAAVKKEHGKKHSKPSKAVPKERKLEKELLGILIVLGALIVIFLVASAYFKSRHTFDYNGLTFREERFGNIPVFHHSYFFKTQGGKLINYNLFLRNDPREIDWIPVNGKISFTQNEVVFISVDSPGLQSCFYSPLATGSISNFLNDNQIATQGGNLDFFDAGTKRQKWITCDNTSGNKVIEIRTGNETRIDIDGKCHVIQVANCKVLEAVERFEVQTIIDANKVKI